MAATAAQATVRRVVIVVLLAIAVGIAAIGLSGLVERMLGLADPLAGSDTTGLALALAFALVGVPLAGVLWWLLWRRLDDPVEREAPSWGVYLLIARTVSLVVATIGLLEWADALVGGRWLEAELATGIVWAGVWAWHVWMSRHAGRSPVRLASVPAVVGAAYGLVLWASGGVRALGALVDAALAGQVVDGFAGSTWWTPVVEALPWLVVGLAVWWWHLRGEGAGAARTVFADVVTLLVGIAAAASVALYGAGTLVDVLLRLAFDASATGADLAADTGDGVGLLLVGVLVWRIHHRMLAGREPAVRSAETFAVSGVAVVATAIGIGVSVNGGLAALVPAPLAGAFAPTVLLAGLSALLVGAPVWWLAWRPLRPVPPEEAASTGRRVFLVVLFGVSALVALISLLIIGYRLFEHLLEGAGPAGGLLDAVRAPVGWLVATAVVSAYHFATWRADRRHAPTARPDRRRRSVMLVAGGDVDALATELGERTGAKVTVLRRIDAETAPDVAAVMAAVETSDAARMLVVAGERGVESVPLAE
ncbi:hypothetical protein ARHIZOSPH14_30080 [Agromyces rhizosphaerae]|uniref:DUF5671 domain-containing protein n=1 Tax=Agromyces rhizosphaerae TaxID=88374 RepID=A0A9W6CTK6_9MICO|nr:DUF5671 domain-containing protein [Agromyces rhizosphaerae]GLI28766.1 hypothetical protein ARHIZOSPH14_30080 [Agromyces rhizosphaerae]